MTLLVVAGMLFVGSRTQLQLQLQDPAQQSVLPQYGPGFAQLAVNCDRVSRSTVRVKIAPRAVQRWEAKSRQLCSRQALYDLQLPKQGEPFTVTVNRQTPAGVAAAGQQQAAVFDSAGSRLVFKQQYLEWSTWLHQNTTVYGFGQHVQGDGSLKLPRSGVRLTLWNRAASAGHAFWQNLYGSHPFFLQVDQMRLQQHWLQPSPLQTLRVYAARMLCRNADGLASGVLLLNSNAMDVQLEQTRLTYKVVGGVLDFYVFLGHSPEAVLQQYQAVVGRPVMPPYGHWASTNPGKWGYKSVAELRNVTQQYKQADIPLEVMWSDIDHMDRYRDFTFNPVGYPAGEMAAYVNSLHAAGQRWVPIIDCGIRWWGMTLPTSRAWLLTCSSRTWRANPSQGRWLRRVAAQPVHSSGHYVKWWAHSTVHAHLEAALCNSTACHALEADLSRDIRRNPACIEQAVARGHALPRLPVQGAHLALVAAAAGAHVQPVKFDGLWIDMNEGEQCHLPQTSPLHRLMHTPGLGTRRVSGRGFRRSAAVSVSRVQPLELSHRTLPMSARGLDGTPHYDTHNLYGWAEAAATYNALAGITRKRPFVLTRATCGACRWRAPTYAASPSSRARARADQRAFYTFSRTHKAYGGAGHGMYRWDSVAKAARKALGMRYRLLPYLYSAFYSAHTQGGSVAKPLFFPFPADATARDVSDQWLLGDGLMVSPVLHKNSSSRHAYFPAGVWHDLWAADKPAAGAASSSTQTAPVRGPTMQSLHVPVGDVPLHVRGGSIVPMQRAASLTDEVRKSPVTLVVALEHEGTQQPVATTPERCMTIGTGAVGHYQTSASADAGDAETAAVASSVAAGSGMRTVACGQLYVDDAGGADAWAVTVNGNKLAAGNVLYDAAGQVLLLSGLQKPLAKAMLCSGSVPHLSCPEKPTASCST
ncbi:glycosyl hydrolases family 31-domain-containing protein [Scenedesmus sp. NREL 46B-D3]|nr:glycosyl hydrolases family 31-domain-containing protein [Scenedesmus sp. NREL 46B-D3]